MNKTFIALIVFITTIALLSNLTSISLGRETTKESARNHFEAQFTGCYKNHKLKKIRGIQIKKT